jgi:glycosyltransferase involved in cell wall biosynthesis
MRFEKMRICLTGPCSPRDVSELLNAQDAVLADSIKGERGIPVSCLAKALVNLNHQVTVVTSTDQTSIRLKFSGPNFDLIVIPQRKSPRDLALSLYRKEVSMIAKELQNLDVDIINAHWTYEHALASIRSSSRCVVTAHDSPWQVLRTANHPFWLFRFIMAAMVKVKFSNMIFVSEDLHQKWKREMFWNKRSWIIPNMQPFQVSELSRPLRPTGELNILSIGDTSKRKNIVGAISAFNKVKKNFPATQLNLVGPGLNVGSAYYKNVAKRHSIEGVNWHGYLERSELRTLMQSCDVLLQPSLVESFGLSLVEGMSLGLSVVAGSNTGAAIEVIGEAGILVDTRSEVEMAEALSRLLENQNYREVLAMNSKRRVSQKFSSNIIAEATLDCYRAVLER